MPRSDLHAARRAGRPGWSRCRVERVERRALALHEPLACGIGHRHPLRPVDLGERLRPARSRRPLQLELAELQLRRRSNPAPSATNTDDPLARRVRERAELGVGDVGRLDAELLAELAPGGIQRPLVALVELALRDRPGAPSSFAAQYGPPMWAISTSGSGVSR